MILGLEIGMIVWGLVALFRGEFQLNPTRVVKGVAARLIGLLLLLPLPVSFAIGFLIGLSVASEGRRFDPAAWRLTLVAVEAAVTLGCLAVALLAGLLCGQTVRKVQ